MQRDKEANESNAFIDKLSGHAPLSAEDVEILKAACGEFRDIPARHDLIREGDKPGPTFVILKGWACRYKMLPEGTRQITAFLMPGDCSDTHAMVLEQMEHTIATLTPARVAKIPARADGRTDNDPPRADAGFLMDAAGR
jgi:CRP-like cAMP-binding protein